MERKFQKLKRVTRTKLLTDAEAKEYQVKAAAADAAAPEVIAKFRAKQAAAQIGAQARAAREQQQLTLQQVAERSGMDVSNLAKLESGLRENPTLDTLFRVASALGKQVELHLVD